MAKIYTKTGDKGRTSLFGGQKVSKSHIRITAFGDVDELNSYMGLLAAYTINAPYQEYLLSLQHTLFNLGASLATEDSSQLSLPQVKMEDIQGLEKEIDRFTEELFPLKQFILPGGHREVAFCHLARCVCRRAERSVVVLHEQTPVDPLILQFLNRLSDYLFVFARVMTKNLGAEEVLWNPVK